MFSLNNPQIIRNLQELIEITQSCTFKRSVEMDQFIHLGQIPTVIGFYWKFCGKIKTSDKFK